METQDLIGSLWRDVAREAAEFVEEEQTRLERYRVALEQLRDMTHGQLLDNVEALPVGIMNRLARGPHPDRYSCGVCRAFGSDWFDHLPDSPSPFDPMWLVFGYHEAPKLDMKVQDDQWDGPAANEVYRRCIRIYRAAGFSGYAAPPNA